MGGLFGYGTVFRMTLSGTYAVLYNRVVDSDLERALRGLDEATAFAKSFRFELDAEYLALIARVESLPQNGWGADKSGRWRGSRAGREALVASARLLSDRP